MTDVANYSHFRTNSYSTQGYSQIRASLEWQQEKEYFPAWPTGSLGYLTTSRLPDSWGAALMIMRTSTLASTTDYLGSIVTVVVDRPAGSYHPENHTLFYPINYGYVPGTLSQDGDELDAYILGVYVPLSEFTGECIAILKRLTEVDDKLVVVPHGKEYSDAQIRVLTEFQEYHDNVIIVRSNTELQL